MLSLTGSWVFGSIGLAMRTSLRSKSLVMDAKSASSADERARGGSAQMASLSIIP